LLCSRGTNWAATKAEAAALSRILEVRDIARSIVADVRDEHNSSDPKGFFFASPCSALVYGAKLDASGRRAEPALHEVSDVAVRDHLGMICAANRIGAPFERTR